MEQGSKCVGTGGRTDAQLIYSWDTRNWYLCLDRLTTGAARYPSQVVATFLRSMVEYVQASHLWPDPAINLDGQRLSVEPENRLLNRRT